MRTAQVVSVVAPLLLLVATTATTASAFSPSTSSHVAVLSPRQKRTSAACRFPTPPPQRTLTIVHSAKILPVAYAGASAALLFRASKATNVPDAAVLLSTAALALVNLGPTDNARLASAKRAYKNTPPAVAGVAKQQRQAAKTWRSAVRIKIFGQLAGLVRMACDASSAGVMKGAATVMMANVAFFFVGAGGARHDDEGNFDPMPAGLSRTVSAIDTVLTIAALVAASSPLGSTRRAVGAGVFAAGAVMGALEGIASLVTSR